MIGLIFFKNSYFLAHESRLFHLETESFWTKKESCTQKLSASSSWKRNSLIPKKTTTNHLNSKNQMSRYNSLGSAYLRMHSNVSFLVEMTVFFLVQTWKSLAEKNSLIIKRSNFKSFWNKNQNHLRLLLLSIRLYFFSSTKAKNIYLYS